MKRSISKKVIATLMAVLMVAAVSTTSAFAIAAGSYTPSFSTWPASHGPLFPGNAVVTNANNVSTVTAEINTHFTIHGVTGDITDVTLLSGSPYLSANLTTIGGTTYLVVTCADSVTAAGFAPELEFEITYASHTNSTDGTFKIL
jgi:hypothetical protein